MPDCLKIVDTNSLKSTGLEEFLAQSPENKAVLAEPVIMESFKGGIEMVRRNLKILSAFPDQVVVLRGNSQIWRFHPKENDLRQRMACEKTTKQFWGFTGHLSNPNPISDFESHMSSLTAEAKQTDDELIQSAAEIRNGIALLARQCTAEERKSWRAGPLEDPGLIQKLFFMIAETAIIQIMGTGVCIEPPQYKDAIYSLQFRFAACGYMLAMNKVSNGGFEETPLERVRNDWTDMLIAAYGTFFDGVISNDKKLNESYATAQKFIAIVQQDQRL